MFRTFKGQLETIIGSDILPDGTMWIEPSSGHINFTKDMSNEIFTFSKDEIIFSDEQLKTYKDFIRLDPFLGTKLRDGTKYTLNKHYKKAKANYEIDIDKLPLKIHTNPWNKFRLNTIHNRYWLFNESKWFVTFALSIAGFILAIVALCIKSC